MFFSGIVCERLKIKFVMYNIIDDLNDVLV